MCIIAKDVQIAEEDIKVYKVFRYGSTPFKNHKGHDSYNGEINFGMSVKDVIENKAKGFGTGNGYSVFLSKKTATAYISEIERCHGWEGLELVKLVIPAGAKYAKGRIENRMIGGSLPAIRCEYLGKVA